MAMEVVAKKGLEKAKKEEQLAKAKEKLRKSIKELEFTKKVGGDNPSMRNLRNVEYRAKEVKKAANEVERLK